MKVLLTTQTVGHGGMATALQIEMHDALPNGLQLPLISLWLVNWVAGELGGW